ncbi:MAG TPA: NAD(P)/FAD-dependent oxidoreductase, partial [Epsilonproteobacteria bacterium]|nr:NAD(P)/FAD-dependent oxidoreductase [Campylobacterota bacterium]
IWRSPVTTCFSLLRTQPQECISLYTEYDYDKKGKMRFKNSMTDEAWKSNGLGDARVAYAWAESMYQNMFY